jgi:hypothetical protein
MRFADDRRGRVPFALVGVVLLVTASVYATGVADRADPPIERPAAESLDATSRDVRPALRTAVRDAARDAARNPVTEPADTPTGRVLNDSAPFVDSVRVRVAVAARAALDSVGRNSGDLRTSVSLPPIDDASDLRTAKRGVSVAAADGGEAMTVTVRNVSVRAHRDGRVVAERRLNVTLTVRTPVLALHERATTYEQRLNRGPLDGPGLGRSVTARLYPVTMARGYARYGGAPIQNVLGNRHVELSTNTALLAQQRAVFGRHDPAAADAVEVATVRLGVTDVLAPRNGDAADAAKTALRPNAVGDDHGVDGGSGRTTPDAPDAPPIASSPDAAADEAYLGVSDDISAVTAGSYRVEGHLRVDVLDRAGRDRPPAAEPPGENWTLVTERTSNRTVVSAVADDRNDTRATVQRTRWIVVHHTTTRLWLRGGETRTTTVQWREEARVAISVVTAYGPEDAAPERSTVPLFREGGVLDGPNLVGSRDRVARQLLAENGGVNAIARRVADGQTDSLRRNTSVVADRPERLSPWVASDLRDLRRAVANVSVNVSRKRVAAGEANPAALLAEKLRTKRTALLDAPEQYDGAADRARVAARAAYLDRVITALERRAEATEARNQDYRDKVGDGVARRLGDLVSVGTGGAGTAEEGHVGGPAQQGDEQQLRIRPDASPAYLTMTAVDSDHVPTVPRDETVHPLAVETTNWFAMPYGDAADRIVGAVFDEKTVSLETAAGTLVAANRTMAASENGTENRSAREAALAANREELTGAVGRSVRRIENDICVAARNGTDLSREACWGAVRDLRGHWPGVGHRGLAMGNGSYADAFAAALEARGVDAATATDAGVRVRVSLRELTAERRTSVPAETTNQTATATRAFAREELKGHTQSTLERGGERAKKRLNGVSRLPTGLPLAPPPYTWVATVNAWSVTVRGEYQRFALRAPAGSPDGGGGVVRYVRDGSAVTLDVDGDGEEERLGTNERVRFETGTTVVAAVPPGPPGIGDVDGDRTERSPGWPCPGADDAEMCKAANDG